jgi:predicted transcriptional regulator
VVVDVVKSPAAPSRKDTSMSLREPRFTTKNNHVQVVLHRAQQEMARTGNKSVDFRAICTMVSIPHDLRQALLKTLIEKGYVTRESGELIQLTKSGTALAVAPLA